MLRKVYRIGTSSRHRVGKAYVLSAEPPPGLLNELSLTNGITAQHDYRNRRVLLLVTGMAWMHTPDARRRVFADLAAALRVCSQVLGAKKLALLPSAVSESGSDWRNCLSPDRNITEVHDEIEQAHACNLLAQASPILQACAGRAGVTPAGVERLHWKLGAESKYFPAVEWLSTVRSHRDRVQRALKETEGIPRLERMEVFPSETSDTLNVNSSIADGAVFLSTTLALSVLHQAIVLRARRLAREGGEPESGWRSRVERNRARVITDGPSALLEPGQVPARVRLLALVEDLRPELQALGVIFPEIAPLVLGPALRSMGRGGLCTENEYLRYLQQHRGSDRLIAEIRDLAISQELRSPLMEVNQKRFPAESLMIDQWWSERLIPIRDQADTTQRVAAPLPTANRAEHARKRSETDPAQRLWRSVQQATTQGTGLAASLIEATSYLDPKDLGRLIQQLARPEFEELVRLLAPKSGAAHPVPIGDVWNNEPAQRAVEAAAAGRIGVIAFEGPMPEERSVIDRVKEVFARTPSGFVLFSWRRVRYQSKIRQELLLVRRHSK